MKSIAVAIEVAEGQAALVKRINANLLQHGKPIKQQHVYNWLNRDERVPAEYCIAIEQATGGAVTRYDLRPDVFGAAPTQQKAA